jgi:hypothetical protein
MMRYEAGVIWADSRMPGVLTATETIRSYPITTPQ